MAGVDFILGANTQGFSSGLKGARAEANKSFKAIEDRANKFGNTLDKAFKGTDKAVQSLTAAIGAGGLGMALSAAGVAASMTVGKLIDIANASVEAKTQLEALAKVAGVTTEEWQKLSVVASTLGADFESAMSEADSAINNFVASGKGLDGYLDLIKGKVERTQADFKKLGTMDALKLINEDLNKVGASTEQKIQAFKQLGASVTDLQPILGMTNEAINKTFADVAAVQINISNETKAVIDNMNRNMKTFGHNYDTLIAEKFRNMYDWIGKIQKKLAESTYDAVINAKANNAYDDIQNGKTVSFAGDSEDEAKAKIAALRNRKVGATTAQTGHNFNTTDTTGMYGGHVRGKQNVDANNAQADLAAKKEAEYQAVIDKIEADYNASVAASSDRPDVDSKANKKEEDLVRKKLELTAKYAANEKAAAEAAYELALYDLRNKESKYLSEEELALAEVKLAEDKNKKIAEIEAKAAEEMRKIDMQKLADAQAFATDKKVINDMQLAQDVAALEQRFAEANKNGEVVSEEQKLNKIAELRREHNSRQLEIELADVADADNRRVFQAEKEMEFLREQRELGLITQEEFNARELEGERNLSEARTQLVMNRLNEMSNLFSGMSHMLEKGSKEQKAIFAMEKAAAIAQMTINGYKAWTDVDKDPTMVTQYQKMAAKAMVVAQYGSQIAAAGAVMVKGQAHDGMTNLPSTGSYILEQGERVVSKGQNADLTNYLENNKNSGGETNVSADLVIQGDASGLSDDKFNEYLIKHRENIAKAMSLAKAENPSL